MVQTILRPVLLRRTKKTKDNKGNYIIQLPEKHEKVEYIEMSVEEFDFY
jgi:DNA repair protein RAD5